MKKKGGAGGKEWGGGVINSRENFLRGPPNVSRQKLAGREIYFNAGGKTEISWRALL